MSIDLSTGMSAPVIENRRPTLCIVAGPNGSGKTSTTQQLLANEWSAGSVYINPDNIAQEEFGDWNSPQAVMKAAQRATELRYRCLSERKDFVFETVFSSDEKLEFLCKAKAAGYFVRYFYVCTHSPFINVQRVAARFVGGGHEVPLSKIINRYYRSLTLASEAIRLSDRAYLYDNSVENQTPQLLCRTVDGIIKKQYVPRLPEWAKALLPCCSAR